MADHIGTRIAYWRRRRGGMTQTALAGLAGVTQSYISKVESGVKGVERRATLIAIARALQVTVADLVGVPGDPADPVRDAAMALIPEIRAAIIEVEEGDIRPARRTPAETGVLAEVVDGMRARSEYAAMPALLPGFLRDAAAHGGLLLVRAGYETSVCLRNLGHRDLSLAASRIAVRAAGAYGDVAWMGAANFIHTLTMPIEAAGTTSRLAERALTELQRHAADTSVRQMYGQLLLSASMACAVDGRSGDAEAHLAEARREAATLGDPADGAGFNLCSFGPTNLALWRMAVDVELGEFGRVIETARTVSPAPLTVANRHQSYWMSLGRALAHSGKTDREALAALTRAERAAPFSFGLSPLARDTVGSLVYRAQRRAVSTELRVMARRVGVDVAV